MDDFHTPPLLDFLLVLYPFFDLGHVLIPCSTRSGASSSLGCPLCAVARRSHRINQYPSSISANSVEHRAVPRKSLIRLPALQHWLEHDINVSSVSPPQGNTFPPWILSRGCADSHNARRGHAGCTARSPLTTGGGIAPTRWTTHYRSSSTFSCRHPTRELPPPPPLLMRVSMRLKPWFRFRTI